MFGVTRDVHPPSAALHWPSQQQRQCPRQGSPELANGLNTVVKRLCNGIDIDTKHVVTARYARPYGRRGAAGRNIAAGDVALPEETLPLRDVKTSTHDGISKSCQLLA